MSKSEILLYEHPVSSYAQKVKIALREKQIPFKSEIPTTLSLSSTDANTPFDQINPRREVPVLVDDDVKLFQASIILEYLEERYPGTPALLPRDPAARARSRTIQEMCDTHYEAINWGVGELRWMKRAESDSGLEAAMLARAAKQTQEMLAWLGERLGAADFFDGERFGLADAAVAPVLNRSVYYGMGPDESSPLGRWHARVSERPSVRETFAEFDAGVARIDDAFADEIKSGGQRKREYRDHRLEWMIRSGGIDIVTEGLRRNNIRFTWPDGR